MEPILTGSDGWIFKRLSACSAQYCRPEKARPTHDAMFWPGRADEVNRSADDAHAMYVGSYALIIY